MVFTQRKQPPTDDDCHPRDSYKEFLSLSRLKPWPTAPWQGWLTTCWYLLSSELTKTLLELKGDEAKYMDFSILAHPEDVDEILTRHLAGHGIRGHLLSRGSPLDMCRAPLSQHLPVHMRTRRTPYNMIKKGLQEMAELKPVLLVDRGKSSRVVASSGSESERCLSPDALAGVLAEVKVIYEPQYNLCRQSTASSNAHQDSDSLVGMSGVEAVPLPASVKRSAPSPSGLPAKRPTLGPTDTSRLSVVSPLLVCTSSPQQATVQTDHSHEEQQPAHAFEQKKELPEASRDREEFDETACSRSLSPLSLLTRKRLAYRNPIPNFNKNDAYHRIQLATDYAHYLYGRPPDVEETIVELTDESRVVGRFCEETCRGKMVQTFSTDGLMPDDSEADPMINELVEMAGYDTASPYPDSDDPHCCSPFPSVSRYLDCGDDPYRDEYGLASESSGDESECSDGDEHLVFEALSGEDSDVDDEEEWSCENCNVSNHSLEIRCRACHQWRCHAQRHVTESSILPESGACTYSSQGTDMGDSLDSGTAMGSSETPVSAAGAVTATDMCLICANSPRSGCIIHGKTAHNVTCFGCAKRLKRRKKPCPICRQSIDGVVLLYTQ